MDVSTEDLGGSGSAPPVNLPDTGPDMRVDRAAIMPFTGDVLEDERAEPLPDRDQGVDPAMALLDPEPVNEVELAAALKGDEGAVPGLADLPYEPVASIRQ